VHFGRDVKGHNNPQHWDVEANELPKQIFMLLPLVKPVKIGELIGNLVYLILVTSGGVDILYCDYQHFYLFLSFYCIYM
jgi:hypothetical protein